MRTKAGIACLAIAAFALAAFAAAGLGARFTGLAKVSRPGATILRAQVSYPAAKQGQHTPSVAYGGTKPTPLTPGTPQTVTLTGCPTGTHIVNGSVAALHGQQARYLTMHGQGLASINGSKKVNAVFVDVSNDSDTLKPPGFDVKAFGSIVCVK